MKYMIKRCVDNRRKYNCTLDEVKNWFTIEPDDCENDAEDEKPDIPDFSHCNDADDINAVLYDLENGNPLYLVYEQFDIGSYLNDGNTTWKILDWDECQYGADQFVLVGIDGSEKIRRKVPYSELVAMKRIEL